MKGSSIQKVNLNVSLTSLLKSPGNHKVQTSKGLWSQKRDLRPLKHEALEPDNGPGASDTLEAWFTGASPGCTRAAPDSIGTSPGSRVL